MRASCKDYFLGKRNYMDLVYEPQELLYFITFGSFRLAYEDNCLLCMVCENISCRMVANGSAGWERQELARAQTIFTKFLGLDVIFHQQTDFR